MYRQVNNDHRFRTQADIIDELLRCDEPILAMSPSSISSMSVPSSPSEEELVFRIIDGVRVLDTTNNESTLFDETYNVVDLYDSDSSTYYRESPTRPILSSSPIEDLLGSYDIVESTEEYFVTRTINRKEHRIIVSDKHFSYNIEQVCNCMQFTCQRCKTFHNVNVLSMFHPPILVPTRYFYSNVCEMYEAFTKHILHTRGLFNTQTQSIFSDF